jgi:hypothetical protein
MLDMSDILQVLLEQHYKWRIEHKILERSQKGEVTTATRLNSK